MGKEILLRKISDHADIDDEDFSSADLSQDEEAEVIQQMVDAGYDSVGLNLDAVKFGWFNRTYYAPDATDLGDS